MTPPPLALQTPSQRLWAAALDSITACAIAAAPQVSWILAPPPPSADPQRGVALGLAALMLWAIGLGALGLWVVARDLGPLWLSPGRRLVAGGPVQWVTAAGDPVTGRHRLTRLAYRLALTGGSLGAAGAVLVATESSVASLALMVCSLGVEIRSRLDADGRSWPDRHAGVWLVRVP